MLNLPDNMLRYGTQAPSPQAMMLPPARGGITPGPALDPRGAWLAQMGRGGGIFAKLFQKLLAGRVSGGTGMRGPDPNPFAGLARFAGPFGNGGGPLVPSFGNLFRR